MSDRDRLQRLETAVRALADDAEAAIFRQPAETVSALAVRTWIGQIREVLGGPVGVSRGPAEAAEPATSSGIRFDERVETTVSTSCESFAGWEAAEAGAPEPASPEPGYQRIADAINAACEAADIDLTVVHDGRVLDYVPGVRWLATVLDKAGLIDWAAFADTSPEETPK